MREIKFRAWYDNGTGEQGMLYVGDRKGTKHPLDCCVYAIQGQPVTLMQFTGLCDRMGKEIYEGDVVNMKVLIVDYNENTEIDRTYTGVVAVIPSKGACMKRPKFIDRCEDDLTGWCDYNKPIAAYRSEVVGNIYENPELMEGKE